MGGLFEKRLKLSTTDLKFGSWKITTLAIPGAEDIVSEELQKYKINIVALQKVRWPYCEKANTKHYIVYYSRTSDGAHRAVVGFALNKLMLNDQ